MEKQGETYFCREPGDLESITPNKTSKYPNNLLTILLASKWANISKFSLKNSSAESWREPLWGHTKLTFYELANAWYEEIVLWLGVKRSVFYLYPILTTKSTMKSGTRRTKHETETADLGGRPPVPHRGLCGGPREGKGRASCFVFFRGGAGTRWIRALQVGRPLVAFVRTN